jgi:hypothetical protein
MGINIRLGTGIIDSEMNIFRAVPSDDEFKYGRIYFMFLLN